MCRGQHPPIDFFLFIAVSRDLGGCWGVFAIVIFLGKYSGIVFSAMYIIEHYMTYTKTEKYHNYFLAYTTIVFNFAALNHLKWGHHDKNGT